MNVAALTRQPDDAARLASMAKRLWPDEAPHADHNRRAWLRAVASVRRSARGWLAESQRERIRA